MTTIHRIPAVTPEQQPKVPQTAPEVDLLVGPSSEVLAPDMTPPAPVDPQERGRKGFSTKAKLVAGGAALALAASIGVAYGLNRKTSAGPAPAPSVSATLVPGNTVSAPATPNVSASPSKEQPVVVKPGLRPDSNYEDKYYKEDRATALAAIESAKTPQEAAENFRKLDITVQDSFLQTLLSNTYEGNDINAMIYKFNEDNPGVLPKDFISAMEAGTVGPGHETMSDDQQTAYDLLAVKLMAAMIIQDQKLDPTLRHNMSYAVLGSAYKSDLVLTQKAKAGYSVQAPGDAFSELEKLFVASQSGAKVGILSFDMPTGVTTIKEPSFCAKYSNSNVSAGAQVGNIRLVETTLVDGKGNKMPGKPVVVIFVSPDTKGQALVSQQYGYAGSIDEINAFGGGIGWATKQYNGDGKSIMIEAKNAPLKDSVGSCVPR